MALIYNGILLSHESNSNNAICSNMGRPRDRHTEWSKSEKVKCHMISLTCGILKKLYKWTYLPYRSRITDVENVGYQWGKSESEKWKLLSYVLLFATQRTIQSMAFSRHSPGVGSHYLLQGIFSTQKLNPGLPNCRWILYQLNYKVRVKVKVKLLSRVRLFATPWTVAYQAPLSMGFSRQG